MTEQAQRHSIRPLVVLAGGLGVLALLIFVSDVVRLVVVAALLAYLLAPLVRGLESHGLSRTLATSAVFLGLLLALVGIVLSLFPLAAAQLHIVYEGLQQGQADAAIRALERFLSQALSLVGIHDFDLSGSIRNFLLSRVGNMVDYLPSALSLIANIVVVPFIMFFLLRDSGAIKRGIAALVPNRYFELTFGALHKMDEHLGNYLRSQILDAVVVGLLSIAALWALGVPSYVLIGTVAGATNLIPYVGPVVGALIAVLISGLTGGTLLQAGWIILVFAGIQLVDTALVYPVVVARGVRLHPLLVLLVLLVGGEFFGLIGLLLAVPAAAVARVLFIETLETMGRYRLQ